MSSTKRITVAVIIAIMTITGCGKQEPKCIWDGCNNNRAPGSSYCYLHELSDENRANNKSHSGTTKQKTTTGNSQKSTESKHKMQTGPTTKSTSGYNSHKKYDEGYEDVYENDDWDWDRYMEDDDYAEGVDDALEDLEDDWDW